MLSLLKRTRVLGRFGGGFTAVYRATPGGYFELNEMRLYSIDARAKEKVSSALGQVGLCVVGPQCDRRTTRSVPTGWRPEAH